MPTLDFVENAAIWSFAGLLAFSGTPLAAIAFLTIAPKFVIALRTGNLGGIVTLYVDGVPAAVVDTYSDTVGVIETILVGDSDLDEHQIYVQKDDNPDTIIEVIRKELTADEVTPANIRYDAESDTVQQSTDGGVTWNDAPGLDPRHADSFRTPPNSTGAPQCNAAANMVAYLQSLVALDLANAEMTGLAAGFVAILLPEIPVIGWIIDAVILAAETLIALGASAISSAFTSDVYDQLLCTFRDHTDSDGQMSDAQNVDFINDVFANYSSTVYDVILAHNLTLGAVGWSNAGALGEITDADCSCGTWCYTFDFSTGQHGWDVGGFFGANPVGTWTGSSFQTGHDVPNDIEVLQIFIPFTITEVTGVDVRFHGTTGDPGFFNFDYLVSGSSIHTTFNTLLSNHIYPADSDVGGADTATCDEMVIGVESGSFSNLGTIYIDRVTLFGTGTNPFGASNC